VHCLLAGKRSLIMEVDNRSAEISRDTGLPTAKPEDMEAVRRWIQGPTPLRIQMNGEAINRWRAQFTGAACGNCLNLPLSPSQLP
jgi:hypothetical protein